MLVLGVNVPFNGHFAEIDVNGSKTTSISVNARDGAMTILALTSVNYSDGANTCSWVHMLRLGYDGNNVSSTLIASSNPIAAYTPSFYASQNGNLVISTPSYCNLNVILFANRYFRYV